jgi:hypothetical protein
MCQYSREITFTAEIKCLLLFQLFKTHHNEKTFIRTYYFYNLCRQH